MTSAKLNQLLAPQDTTLDSPQTWEGRSGPVRFSLRCVNGYYHMNIFLGGMLTFSCGPRVKWVDILEETVEMLKQISRDYPQKLHELADWLEQERPSTVSPKSAFERL